MSKYRHLPSAAAVPRRARPAVALATVANDRRPSRSGRADENRAGRAGAGRTTNYSVERVGRRAGVLPPREHRGTVRGMVAAAPAAAPGPARAAAGPA